jgi:hypothetical protein
MKELELHDQRHLEAAQGWCELHAFLEADAELGNITASLRAHPKMLEVRWQIYANLEKWAGALEIASAIVKMVPDWPSGWIYRASSLLGATTFFPVDIKHWTMLALTEQMESQKLPG